MYRDSELEENESVENEDGRDASLSTITSRWAFVRFPSMQSVRTKALRKSRGTEFNVELGASRKRQAWNAG